MSLFGFNFKKHHVHKMDSGVKYQAAQYPKIAIEQYFVPRKLEVGAPNPLTNTVLFLTPIEKEQLAAHIKKKVGTRAYSHDKPFIFDYPDAAENRFVCEQTVSAVVIVTNDPKAKFKEGATTILTPTVRLYYGNTGGTGAKVPVIFHLDDTAAFGMLSQTHQAFSTKQKGMM